MFDDLRALYDAYINNRTEQWKSLEARDVLASLFAMRGRFGQDVWVAPLLQELEAFISGCAALPVDGATAARMLTYMLFDVHESAPEPAVSGLEAADGQALPLIPLLSREELAPLYERYRAQLRKDRGLPCQRNVLKAMKRALSK